MHEKKESVNQDPAGKEDPYKRFLPLCRVIEKGDLNGVKGFLKSHPDAINKKIALGGLTALHLATISDKENIVKELVNSMSVEDLQILDDRKTTAFFIAVSNGCMRTVDLLFKKNNNLVTVPLGTELPVITACGKGFRELTRFLYSKTPFELLLPENGTFGALLLHSSFFNKMFEISLDLIQRCPMLAVTKTHFNTNPLIELSFMSELFPSSSRLPSWKRWIYSGIQVQVPVFSRDVNIMIEQSGQLNGSNVLLSGLRSLGSIVQEIFGFKQIYDMKLTHSSVIQIINYIFEGTSITNFPDIVEKGLDRALFSAIEHGTIEIVIEILKVNPSIFILENTRFRSIIEYAIQHRQEKVFSLIYAVGGWKNFLIYGFDTNNNNTLHVAGMLASPNRLAHISSPALQMQRELQWYKEVESIVKPTLKLYVNKDDENPWQLFTKSHKKLKEDGEKWMKGIAKSSTVVGALIITIMFTTVFTVPGGNIQETGFPIFLREKAFKVFIVADAISLFASSTSVLMFLGVLTSRYGEEDFLESLPRKMIIGLSTLFFSIAAMMISFCATLIIMLDGDLKLIIPIILLASIPVTVFIFLQFPLLVEIFMSTYGPGIFDKNMKYWY
ncbi:uncharacterized protein LOC105650939 isoform X2 [Jatropha curcas]|uniref:uncharacterized protein LOC105650939 isoform X2 n=1 Tax=Jatropha curcas TaxID=180498 RepID=UPI0018957647|nr:uncharacterized protein LOC105650939 isoform X2 [Jatropha curcas]